MSETIERFRVRFIGPLSPKQIRKAPVRMFQLFGATAIEALEMRERAARQKLDDELLHLTPPLPCCQGAEGHTAKCIANKFSDIRKAIETRKRWHDLAPDEYSEAARRGVLL